MTEKKKKKEVTPVKKPFLRGSIYDSRTLKEALVMFGMVAVTAFVSFLVCSMTSLSSVVLRIGLNLVIFLLIQMIFYQRGINAGTEAVARGENLYVRKERGAAVADSEIQICYHPLKGYLTGFLGTVPLLILAVILALTTSKVVTGYGALPSWMQTYLRRSEVGDALVAYTVTEPMSFVEFVRIIMRICMMPLVSMIGSGNGDLTLLLERLSPLVMLIPAVFYGFGYTRGEIVRTRVHTEIAENTKKRKRQEQKKRRERAGTIKPKGPTQLN